jgi:hypothetical protein
VTENNYNIRAAEAGADLKYITQSWLYSYQQSPEMNQPGLINDDYFGYQHKMIDDIIPRASAAGSAYMCYEDAGKHLFRGYLIAEPYVGLPVVHWMQVKKGSKRQGVATAMLNRFYTDFGYVKGQNLVYTHSSKDLLQGWASKRAKKDWSCVYLPWFKTTLAKHGCTECGTRSWEA